MSWNRRFEMGCEFLLCCQAFLNLIKQVKLHGVLQIQLDGFTQVADGFLKGISTACDSEFRTLKNLSFAFFPYYRCIIENFHDSCLFDPSF